MSRTSLSSLHHPSVLTLVPRPTLANTLRGHWVQTISHLDPVYGGLTAVVPQMATELSLTEHFSIAVASFTETDESLNLVDRGEISVTHWPSSRSLWLRDRSLRARLRNLLGPADGVHIHGIWETHGSISASVAREVGTPYVVSAHGMLDPWALANKRWKKRLYSALVERANLDGAACLHALTRAEAMDYRRFGCRQPIAIIPNGIALPQWVDRATFTDRFPQTIGKRVILFMGRLHFKKGLDLLVDAWATLAARFPSSILVLAGPDSENSKAAIEKKVRDCGLEGSVLFTGMLPSRLKWSALANADCFVLPSYSEGHSVAVLEAMGMGLPVIVSNECHVPEVTEFGAGWQIEAKLKPLIAALETVLSNESSQNEEVGSRGCDLVTKRFSTAVVTRQMAELYRWVQGGPRPTTFELLEVQA